MSKKDLKHCIDAYTSPIRSFNLPLHIRRRTYAPPKMKDESLLEVHEKDPVEGKIASPDLTMIECLARGYL